MSVEIRASGKLWKVPLWTGVRRKGVGVNSVLCTKCKILIHNKCNGVTVALKETTGFVCPQCTDGTVDNAVIKKEIVLGQEGKFEILNKLCYFGSMMESGDGAEEALKT